MCVQSYQTILKVLLMDLISWLWLAREMCEIDYRI